MAAGTVAPSAKFQGWDDNGDPLSGGLLYTYVAGTTTPQATYSEVTLTTPNANPVVLDSAGRAVVYLLPASYKFILKTSAGVTVWSQDNISAVPPSNVDQDIAGTAGEALTANDAVWLSDGSGSTTAGRWYKTDSDNTYSSTLPQAIGMVPADIASAASGSIRLSGRITGLSGLSAGSVYYISATAGGITSSAPTNSRVIGVADSTTSLVLPSSRTPADASATVVGVVNLSTQQLGTGLKTLGSVTPNFFAGANTSTKAPVSGVINVNTTSTGNSGASEQDLLVYSLPANTLDANGRGVRVTGWGVFSGDADAKAVIAKFGATTVTALTFSANANIVNWWIQIVVVRTGATAQVMSVAAIASRAAPGEGQGIIFSSPSTTPAETLSGAVSVGVRADGDNNNNIVQKGLIVEVIG